MNQSIHGSNLNGPYITSTKGLIKIKNYHHSKRQTHLSFTSTFQMVEFTFALAFNDDQQREDSLTFKEVVNSLEISQSYILINDKRNHKQGV
jgi:hypothetical protein